MVAVKRTKWGMIVLWALGLDKANKTNLSQALILRNSFYLSMLDEDLLEC